MTLNETKHTPGPWKVVKPNNPGPQQENDRLIATKDKKHVAEIFQYQNHKNQNGPSLANARLIAAAPELLEACKAFVEAWEKSLQLEKTDTALRLAKTAIAKVAG